MGLYRDNAMELVGKRGMAMKKRSKKGESADKKPNTQTIRRGKYITLLQGLQEGSQPYIVLDHLIRKGHTSTMEIMGTFSIANPTAVISELRKKGCDISSKRIVPKDKTRKPYWQETLEV